MNHQNCWEFWKCPQAVRGKCPAFLTYRGKDCFDFAENYCQRKGSGFQHCSECAWYKKITHDFNRKEKGIEL